jgi:hypothetical protein
VKEKIRREKQKYIHSYSWIRIVGYSEEIPTICSTVIEFIIPKFIEGSTCFGRLPAHHQELQAVFAAFGLYAHTVKPSTHSALPYGHINQGVQIQFRAPDYERCAARNMLSL